LLVASHSATEFMFYPNPTNTDLNFVLFKTDFEMPIRLFDVSGRMILKKTINALDKNINISNLTKGTYILNTPNKSFKIIKK